MEEKEPVDLLSSDAGKGRDRRLAAFTVPPDPIYVHKQKGREKDVPEKKDVLNLLA